MRTRGISYYNKFRIEKVSDESFRIQYGLVEASFEIAPVLQLTIQEYVALSINNGAHMVGNCQTFLYFKTEEQTQKFIDDIVEPLMILNKIIE